MPSHFALMVLFAFFVSLIFALLSKDDPREQLKFGGKLFAGFIGAALLLGWLMYPLPL
jgi:hypothetical protein